MAITGNGDIAGVLQDRKGFNFFAAGVSNSQEARDSEYQRELDLLMEQGREDHLVYFSSLGVLNGVSRYFQHKRGMERVVKDEFKRNTIVRIGNIAWGDNPHTLINHLKANPEAEIQDVYRYIVDRDEFNYWVDLIPEWNAEVNIPGRRMKVAEIAQEIKDGKL